MNRPEEASQTTSATAQTLFKDAANLLRQDIKRLGAQTLDLRGQTLSRRTLLQPASDTNEMAANLTLAYRHLEDASMRLGKAIQAWDGGISCYDRPVTGQVIAPEPSLPLG